MEFYIGSVVIETNGNPRRIMKIWENTEGQGDIYVELYSGLRKGLFPDGLEKLQTKYSIHPSKKSNTVNQIKRSHVYEDPDAKVTNANLSRAIKTRFGFSHIFTTRFTDLSESIHDYIKEDAGDIIQIGQFDPNKYSLFVSLFVGHAETAFDIETKESRIAIKTVGNVKLVFLVSMCLWPAIVYEYTLDKKTVDPNLMGRAFEVHMDGITPEECITTHKNSINLALQNYFQVLIATSDDLEHKIKFSEALERVQVEANFNTWTI